MENNRNINQISEEELAKVNGGYGVISVTYEKETDVVFKWNIGAHVEKIRAYAFLHVFTYGCTVIDRKAGKKKGTDGYCAWYKVSSDDSDYNDQWFAEDEFEYGYIDIYPNIIM